LQICLFLKNNLASLTQPVSLVESRLSHRLELLFNFCGNEVQTVNPTFYHLVKPYEAKQHIFLCEAK